MEWHNWGSTTNANEKQVTQLLYTAAGINVHAAGRPVCMGCGRFVVCVSFAIASVSRLRSYRGYIIIVKQYCHVREYCVQY